MKNTKRDRFDRNYEFANEETKKIITATLWLLDTHYNHAIELEDQDQHIYYGGMKTALDNMLFHLPKGSDNEGGHLYIDINPNNISIPMHSIKEHVVTAEYIEELPF